MATAAPAPWRSIAGSAPMEMASQLGADSAGRRHSTAAFDFVRSLVRSLVLQFARSLALAALIGRSRRSSHGQTL